VCVCVCVCGRPVAPHTGLSPVFRRRGNVALSPLSLLQEVAQVEKDVMKKQLEVNGVEKKYNALVASQRAAVRGHGQ